jgi:hypothetical protein
MKGPAFAGPSGTTLGSLVWRDYFFAAFFLVAFFAFFFAAMTISFRFEKARTVERGL